MFQQSLWSSNKSGGTPTLAGEDPVVLQQSSLDENRVNQDPSTMSPPCAFHPPCIPFPSVGAKASGAHRVQRPIGLAPRTPSSALHLPCTAGTAVLVLAVELLPRRGSYVRPKLPLFPGCSKRQSTSEHRIDYDETRPYCDTFTCLQSAHVVFQCASRTKSQGSSPPNCLPASLRLVFCTIDVLHHRSPSYARL